MKGISGIIGGAILILVLIVVVSLVLASMRYLYGVQQLEMKQAISEVSQPHVVQIGPSSVESSGELFAAYAIYPDGKVERIDQPVTGIHNFQNLLNGDPWAIIVFSNGQWINVTGMQIQSNSWLYSGSYLVPYYPKPINTSNSTDLISLLTDGLRYNYPIVYSSIDVPFLYNGKVVNVTLNLSDPLVYGFGRILVVPITNGSGWLNFTAYGTCFAILVPNATGTWVAIHVELVGGYAFEGQQGGVAFYSWGYNDSYGIYQYPCPPISNTTYTFYNVTGNTTIQNVGYDFTPNNTAVATFNLVRVAIKFTQGQPAQMYLWVGRWNGQGISWDRILLPSIEAPVGSVVGIAKPVYYFQYKKTPYGYGVPIGVNVTYQTTWLDVVNSTWPLNIYSVYVNESSATVFISNGVTGSWVHEYNIYAEPISPELWNVIEVVPSWTNPYIGTVIFNVTYSI